MPDAEQWNHPTWLALQFAVEDPHYYSYQYEVSADGTEYTARAIGDLDCNGTYSTFELSGGLEDGMPTSNWEFVRINELE